MVARSRSSRPSGLYSSKPPPISAATKRKRNSVRNMTSMMRRRAATRWRLYCAAEACVAFGWAGLTAEDFEAAALIDTGFTGFGGLTEAVAMGVAGPRVKAWYTGFGGPKASPYQEPSGLPMVLASAEGEP